MCDRTRQYHKPRTDMFPRTTLSRWIPPYGTRRSRACSLVVSRSRCLLPSFCDARWHQSNCTCRVSGRRTSPDATRTRTSEVRYIEMTLCCIVNASRFAGLTPMCRLPTAPTTWQIRSHLPTDVHRYNIRPDPSPRSRTA